MNHSWATEILKPEAALKISESVQKVELKTSAEIVPMVVRSSTPTGHVLPILLLITSMCYFAMQTFLERYHAEYEYSLVNLVILIIFCFLSWRLSCWAPIQRFLTSDKDMDQSVWRRALLEFELLGIDKTQDRTGILLFVSVLEHEAVVLADKKIADQISPQTWQQVVDILVKGIASKKAEDGFCKAIELCGSIVAEHFPAKAQNHNELANRLQIKD